MPGDFGATLISKIGYSLPRNRNCLRRSTDRRSRLGHFVAKRDDGSRKLTGGRGTPRHRRVTRVRYQRPPGQRYQNWETDGQTSTERNASGRKAIEVLSFLIADFSCGCDRLGRASSACNAGSVIEKTRKACRSCTDGSHELKSELSSFLLETQDVQRDADGSPKVRGSARVPAGRPGVSFFLSGWEIIVRKPPSPAPPYLPTEPRRFLRRDPAEKLPVLRSTLPSTQRSGSAVHFPDG